MFVIESISLLKFCKFKAHCSSQQKVELDEVTYENEARGVKSLKIQTLSRCNKGTIVDGPVKNPNRTVSNVCNRNYQFVESSPCSRLTVARKKG